LCTGSIPPLKARFAKLKYHFEDGYLEEDLVFRGDVGRRYVRRLKGRRCGVSSLGVER